MSVTVLAVYEDWEEILIYTEEVLNVCVYSVLDSIPKVKHKVEKYLNYASRHHEPPK